MELQSSNFSFCIDVNGAVPGTGPRCFVEFRREEIKEFMLKTNLYRGINVVINKSGISQ